MLSITSRSIFAAKAGAKQVFAVEAGFDRLGCNLNAVSVVHRKATDMAVRSRKIVEAQGLQSPKMLPRCFLFSGPGLSHIIHVVQGTIEPWRLFNRELPCLIAIYPTVHTVHSEWGGMNRKQRRCHAW